MTSNARYASRTAVPVQRSRAEIENLLKRYGATAFGFLQQGSQSIIVFELGNRRVMMLLPLPDPNDDEYVRLPDGRGRRAPAQATAVYEQSVRARWRALVLIVKAKLEAVAAGVSTIEREFLADIVLPDGRTVDQFLSPQLEDIYTTGRMPALLPGANPASTDITRRHP